LTLICFKVAILARDCESQMVLARLVEIGVSLGKMVLNTDPSEGK
jgi:hypothetical protein